MHPTVERFFPAFTERFEGKIPWMYLDVKGLVTTGVGCLLPTPQHATEVEWYYKNGQAAGRAAIIDEWLRVKRSAWLATAGARAAESVAQLRLHNETIARLTRTRMESMETTLRREWPTWDSMPADAQLGILSMAWAMGPAFRRGWPRFAAYVEAGDWMGASRECLMRTAGNPGLVPRNKANQLAFELASTIPQSSISSGMMLSK